MRGYGRSYFGSEMMIWRRPKRRASNEYAPGPSNISAMEMIARFRWATELARAGVWVAGNRPKFKMRFPAAASPQQIGVRNPIRTKAPARIAKPPKHQEEITRSGEYKIESPSAAAFSATTNLRRKRPPPGYPFGKEEKSRCSGHLLLRRHRGNLNVIEEEIDVMPRKRHFRMSAVAADKSAG